MTCSCSTDCDYDKPVISRDAWRNAYREEYLCGECGSEIHRGDLYRVFDGLYDQAWYTHRMCRGCSNMADHLAAVCGCFTFGAVHETMAELYEIPIDDVA